VALSPPRRLLARRLGRNPRGRRRRRPLLHHAPSPPPANVVGQSPPAAGGGGTRSPLRCGPASSSQLAPVLRSPPLAPKLPRPAWPSPSVHLPHAGLLPAPPSPPHLHFAWFWQQVIRSRSKSAPGPAPPGGCRRSAPSSPCPAGRCPRSGQCPPSWSPRRKFPFRFRTGLAGVAPCLCCSMRRGVVPLAALHLCCEVQLHPSGGCSFSARLVVEVAVLPSARRGCLQFEVRLSGEILALVQPRADHDGIFQCRSTLLRAWSLRCTSCWLSALLWFRAKALRWRCLWAPFLLVEGSQGDLVLLVSWVALCLLLDSSVCRSFAGVGSCVAHSDALWCVPAP
jgi:hypothetical protein